MFSWIPKVMSVLEGQLKLGVIVLSILGLIFSFTQFCTYCLSPVFKKPSPTGKMIV